MISRPRSSASIKAWPSAKADQTLLEIGCGWGGFAELPPRPSASKVVGLTISRHQFDYARHRIFSAGLTERVDLRLQDYRDERGCYDRIASIEMIEAVGQEYWSAYFQPLRDRLKPQGIAGTRRPIWLAPERGKSLSGGYARTLAAWRGRFQEAWPTLMPLGFDERFRRLWEYDLPTERPDFLSRNIDVRQMIFAKV